MLLDVEPSTITFTQTGAKIAAVVSCPRVGFNDFWGEAISAFSAHNIPVRTITGAYWDQCMQNALQDVVDQGFDYVITADYDSLFTVEDVQSLIDGIQRNPQIDALAAYQPRRGNQAPMFIGNPPRSGGVFAVMAAHFGLTILRTQAFAGVQKPWFIHQPDANNEYHRDDRVDADENFWRKWLEAGRSVYVDPAIRIGHLEVMASEFDENLQARYVSVAQWRKSRAAKSVHEFTKGFK